MRRERIDMDVLILFLLLSVCARAHCAPLGDQLRRRSHGYDAYGGAYEQDYEPYVYAAVPLHAPVPVLHVLSAAPLAAPPAPRPVRARAPPRSQYHTAHDYEPFYGEEQYSGDTQKYEATYTRPQYQPVTMDSQEAVLYAKPNPRGGYVYRKRGGTRNSPNKISPPVIVRIHKYKIVKDS